MPKGHFVVALCFVCLLSLSQLNADQITLKNGDRISGVISSSDGGTLNIKTDYAGSLSVKWDAVQTISSDQPLYVASKDGQLLVGTVTTADNKLLVATRDSGTVTVTRDAVQTLRSESAQHNAEHASDWSGNVDTGLSLSRGNSDTTTFALGAAAARSTTRDKTSVFVTSLFAKSGSGGSSVTTASAIDGGIRYDFNLGARAFAFAFDDLDHDRFQHLDLRNVLGGGLGYHAIKTAATTFDLFGGASFNQEFYSTGLHRRSAELMAGEELDHKLSSSFSVKQRLEFYPNLSETGQYRMVFDSEAVTKLRKFLSWQVAFSDRYISNPILGLKGNTLLLTTGFRLTFGPQK